jgi:hypothetical protein
MSRIVATVCLITLAACAGSESGFAADFGGPDTGAADVPILSDAVVLEPGSRDSPSYDTTVSDLANDAAADSGASDLAIADVPAAWDTFPGDLPYTPDATPLDAPSPDSAGDPGPSLDDAFPDAGADNPPSPCEIQGLPCGPGLACVLDGMSHPYCTPIDECSDKGAIDLQQLVSLLLKGEGEVHVKVKAMAWPGVQTCSIPDVCTGDNTCCKSCFAPMFIGTEMFPIVLQGQGIPIGCQGSECDVLDNCRPLLPESWYWVWGRVSVLGGKARFSVDGFCPVDAQPAGG